MVVVTPCKVLIHKMSCVKLESNDCVPDVNKWAWFPKLYCYSCFCWWWISKINSRLPFKLYVASQVLCWLLTTQLHHLSTNLWAISNGSTDLKNNVHILVESNHRVWTLFHGFNLCLCLFSSLSFFSFFPLPINTCQSNAAVFPCRSGLSKTEAQNDKKDECGERWRWRAQTLKHAGAKLS